MATNVSINNLTAGYLADQTVLDECFGQNEQAKKSWTQLLANIEILGIAELKNRHQELLKILQENGVTYNVYGDVNGLNRPWLLDVIPLIIDAVDWRLIERGMKQRAFVLNKILDDIYGDRVLIKNGIIPPELIYAHPGFLRPCDKVKLPGEHQLTFYSADLSRGPDGKVWVIKDRAQAPSGMGYALENRSALSRAIPELFQQHKIAKLGSFFSSMMQALIRIAPQGKERPRIILLTPGPRNETYFEHAFLASYLGITLVQGEDLIMRDSFVWIKTVEGLEKVDVILRRVDDTFCDPLELREDSQLGIPGLLQAVRKGNVAVANSLGSSILENTGLMAFLHGAFRYFLNEDPIIPMIATWWCGQKKEMDHVIDNLDTLVIKDIERMSGFKTIMGGQLSKAEKEQLVRKIKSQPFRYVGQEEVEFSTSPVFTKEKLEPRFSVLRSYLVATQDGYEIMRGGLARCSPEKGSFLVSNQDGGISKDTWVDATYLKPSATMAQHQAPDMKRKAVLPSRAAENLFWVGRYTQRVIRTSRFIRIVLRNLTQKRYIYGSSDSESLMVLLKATTQITDTFPGFIENAEEELNNPMPEIHQLICNPDRACSILFTLNNLLKSMYAARDRWTIDSWRIIDEIENTKRRIAVLEPEGIRHALSLLDQLTGGLLSFSEMTRQSMYRSDGRIMYRMGQLIEEILMELAQYKAILSQDYDESVEFQLLEALLLSNQNLSSYRSVYRTSLDVSPAIDLLFLNIQNPTSVLSQLEGLLKYARSLAQKEGATDNELSLLVFECYSKVRLMNIDTLIKTDEETKHRKTFENFCSTLHSQILLLATKLSARYFSHSTYQQQGIKEGFQFEV